MWHKKCQQDETSKTSKDQCVEQNQREMTINQDVFLVYIKMILLILVVHVVVFSVWKVLKWELFWIDEQRDAFDQHIILPTVCVKKSCESFTVANLFQQLVLFNLCASHVGSVLTTCPWPRKGDTKQLQRTGPGQGLESWDLLNKTTFFG